ncbi:MAG TPA: UDP-N-acetylmuramoyl-L-alanyl-D-glutamate--2,6-diaminopimelate ligase [Thermomicrobiaceae bacterium]|nr:UDP-N-acetylmuramoyl-L-alanyl-D-glutamate--2,6-diaminopimelate ligase [Thermomicrobiaceae bacterium]
MNVSFGRLAEQLKTNQIWGSPDLPISDVCFDSREAVPGSLFVALPGGYTDGHAFLADARARGAVAALVERVTDACYSFDAFAQVPDTRASLPLVAATFFQRPANSLGMIGITGTDGKTTTSYLVDALLRHAGLRAGVIGTVSVRIGDDVVEHDMRQTTPESLEIQRLLARMRHHQVDWAVLEATSHGLALHRLDETPFDIGVVTNITHEHLEFHKTIEAYRRAKAMLLEKVDQSRGRSFPNGVVLNRDDEGARSIAHYAGAAPVVWFSTRDMAAGIRAETIDYRNDGTRFRLVTPDGASEAHLRLIGPFNVENALAAAGVGYWLRMSPDQIAAGLESLAGIPGRLLRVDEGQPFTVIVDYAHTPDSLEKTLSLVKSLSTGRLCAVFGSAGERDPTKRPLQGAVSAKLADFSIFTSEDPRFENPETIIRDIARGAEAAGAVEGRDYRCIEDRRAAIAAAIEWARAGDAVVLAGKGHEHCIFYGAERIPWNEAEEAAKALRMHGFTASMPT